MALWTADARGLRTSRLELLSGGAETGGGVVVWIAPAPPSACDNILWEPMHSNYVRVVVPVGCATAECSVPQRQGGRRTTAVDCPPQGWADFQLRGRGSLQPSG